MRLAIINAQIALPNGQFSSGHALLVEDGRIAAIQPVSDIPAGYSNLDLNGNILAPGFVDLQVNGGGGALFNDDPSVESLRTIAAAHSRFGTTAFLPTLISDDLSMVRRAISAVDEAISFGVPGIVGIHIEGPFLNIEKKGIHDGDKIRPLDEAGLAAITAVSHGRTLVTVAPECVASEYLRQLSSSGILVCAGHTGGSFEQIMASFEDGVVGVTHLFNAMSQLTNRQPGAVGAALLDPSCWCCIIVDGVHIHPATLKLAMRAKGGTERFILVTDAMPTVGQKEKRFVLNGEPISSVDGVCQNADGTLAGSDLNMAQAVRNAVDLLSVDLNTALRMGSQNPARFLGMHDRFGALEVGLEANMVEIDPNGVVQRTWIGGELMWEAGTESAEEPAAIDDSEKQARTEKC